jgi:hypothetical protein
MKCSVESAKFSLQATPLSGMVAALDFSIRSIALSTVRISEIVGSAFFAFAIIVLRMPADRRAGIPELFSFDVLLLGGNERKFLNIHAFFFA